VNVDVELLRSLDEKYVVNLIAYEAMHAAAALVLDATTWRRADGSLDRDAITAQIAWLAAATPELRKRIVRIPLGLTTPAWVPDAHFAIGNHLRFLDEPIDLGPAGTELLTGRLFPHLSLQRSPWEIVIAEAQDGRVVLIVRFQHVMGDAIWAMGVLDRLLTVGPSGERIEPVLAPSRGPRHLGELLAVAWRQWYALQASPRAAWTEYWRKPLRRRLRRSGGRLLRPVRDRVIERRGLRARYLPARHSASLVLDLAVVTGHAKRYPCTVSDLVLSTVLAAIAARDGAGAALLVPVSRRTKAHAAARNHVSVVRVSIPGGQELAEVVPAVRAQIRAAISAGSAGLAPVTEPVSGYATFIPLTGKDRYLGSARLEQVLAWPAGDPAHDIACFATSYAGRLVITMTTRESTVVAALLAAVAAAIEEGIREDSPAR
jgi:diacylglycerol O-acyltransferase